MSRRRRASVRGDGAGASTGPQGPVHLSDEQIEELVADIFGPDRFDRAVGMSRRRASVRGDGASASTGPQGPVHLSDEQIEELVADIFGPDRFDRAVPDVNALVDDLFAQMPSERGVQPGVPVVRRPSERGFQPGVRIARGPFLLPRIGQFQLISLTDRSTYIYNAIDTVTNSLVRACKLTCDQHAQRLRLAERLSTRVDLSQDNDKRRVYNLVIPCVIDIVSYKEYRVPYKEPVPYYYWFEKPHIRTLYEHVVTKKRLTEDEGKNLFRQICEMIAFCHARGVILRDAKIQNFGFVDLNCQIIRFLGLDDMIACPERKERTSNRVDARDFGHDLIFDRCACPAYVSPEILNLRRAYSGRAADVWSLGVALYVILIGKYPFYDTTSAGLFAKIRQGQFRLSAQEGISFEARFLIRALLKMNASERPSAAEILRFPWLTSPRDYKVDFIPPLNLDDAMFWSD